MPNVEHLGAPEARELLALGSRQRLGRAHDLADRGSGQVDAFRLREIGEMQRKAAHADEHRRLQRLDQLELRRRGMGVAGADPDHAHVEQLSAPRPDLSGRMDPEREREVAEIAGAYPHARERSTPGQLGEAQVIARTRIEHRLSGRAAGAPVFRDLRAGSRAKCRQKLGVGQLAQRVLVKDRDFPPLGGIVERVRIDVVELAAIPRDALRARECFLLLLALDLCDVGA
jgi:hypothetical protein